MKKSWLSRLLEWLNRATYAPGQSSPKDHPDEPTRNFFRRRVR